MKDADLKIQLRSLVDRYGIEQIEHTLKAIATSRRRSAARKRGSNDAAQRNGQRRRTRTTAPEYVAKMDLSTERRTAALALAERFEEKSFLPTCADIRDFCGAYDIEAPASRSRASAIARIFKFVATMDVDELQRLLDENAFSGPSRLGPIAEAIRQNGRAVRSRDVEDTGNEHQGDPVFVAGRACRRSPRLPP